MVSAPVRTWRPVLEQEPARQPVPVPLLERQRAWGEAPSVDQGAEATAAMGVGGAIASADFSAVVSALSSLAPGAGSGRAGLAFATAATVGLVCSRTRPAGAGSVLGSGSGLTAGAVAVAGGGRAGISSLAATLAGGGGRSRLFVCRGRLAGRSRWLLVGFLGAPPSAPGLVPAIFSGPAVFSPVLAAGAWLASFDSVVAVSVGIRAGSGTRAAPVWVYQIPDKITTDAAAAIECRG